MTIIKLFGKVYPIGFRVNLEAPGITYKADDGTLEGYIDVSVTNSDIVVFWAVNDYKVDTFVSIWTHSKKLATSLVNLIAFRMGAAATVILDRYQIDDGQVQDLALGEPKVAGISQVLDSDEGLYSVFSVMANEQHLMIVLEDLIAGLWSHEHKVINCARSVEAVRQLVAGYDLKSKEQWPIFNDLLNLDRGYSELIMRNSQNPRHGKADFPSKDDVDTIMVRTWKIIDRFFHFRVGGNRKLDIVKYPILIA